MNRTNNYYFIKINSTLILRRVRRQCDVCASRRQAAGDCHCLLQYPLFGMAIDRRQTRRRERERERVNPNVSVPLFDGIAFACVCVFVQSRSRGGPPLSPSHLVRFCEMRHKQADDAARVG